MTSEFSDPNLIKPLVPVVLRAIMTSIGVLAVMFTFGYLPTVAVLAVVSGPLGKLLPSFLRRDHSLIRLSFRLGSFHRSHSLNLGSQLHRHHVPHPNLLGWKGQCRSL